MNAKAGPAQSALTKPLSRHAMAYVLAGGRGGRLMELTDRRAKPAAYFGGKSRIIDFALSNAMNSGIRRIAVATQYKAHSLIRKFGPATGENLADAIRRANALFHDKPVWPSD